MHSANWARNYPFTMDWTTNTWNKVGTIVSRADSARPTRLEKREIAEIFYFLSRNQYATSSHGVPKRQHVRVHGVFAKVCTLGQAVSAPSQEHSIHINRGTNRYHEGRWNSIANYERLVESVRGERVTRGRHVRLCWTCIHACRKAHTTLHEKCPCGDTKPWLLHYPNGLACFWFASSCAQEIQ